MIQQQLVTLLCGELFLFCEQGVTTCVEPYSPVQWSAEMSGELTANRHKLFCSCVLLSSNSVAALSKTVAVRGVACCVDFPTGTNLQKVLEDLKDNGGLTIGRLRRMIIVDDIATLRSSFSGFWNKLHVIAMSVFLAPYVWFLAHQWSIAKVGDVVHLKEKSSPILLNLVRFIVSGGDTWRAWRPSVIPIALFVLALVFNFIRGLLLAKTMFLEHQRTVQGHYPDFSITGKWKWCLQTYKLLGVFVLVVLTIHTLMFLLKRVPI